MTATSPARQPGETTRPRRGETRQRILDAAGDLFRAHGVDGVGVDAVMRKPCSVAGVARAIAEADASQRRSAAA